MIKWNGSKSPLESQPKLVLPFAPSKNLSREISDLVNLPYFSGFYWFLHRLAARARCRLYKDEDHVCQ